VLSCTGLRYVMENHAWAWCLLCLGSMFFLYMRGDGRIKRVCSICKAYPERSQCSMARGSVVAQQKLTSVSPDDFKMRTKNSLCECFFINNRSLASVHLNNVNAQPIKTQPPFLHSLQTIQHPSAPSLGIPKPLTILQRHLQLPPHLLSPCILRQIQLPKACATSRQQFSIPTMPLDYKAHPLKPSNRHSLASRHKFQQLLHFFLAI
jgi:hypothetical protein